MLNIEKEFNIIDLLTR